MPPESELLQWGAVLTVKVRVLDNGLVVGSFGVDYILGVVGDGSAAGCCRWSEQARSCNGQTRHVRSLAALAGLATSFSLDSRRAPPAGWALSG
jgi:hypothetical protein